MNLRSIEDAADTNVKEVLHSNGATGIDLDPASNQALVTTDEPMM